jgi:hypothetical protein
MKSNFKLLMLGLINLYYKERRQLKTFHTQFRPALPLTPDPPVICYWQWIGWKDYEVQKIANWRYFCQKRHTFFTHTHPTRPGVPAGPTTRHPSHSGAVQEESRVRPAPVVRPPRRPTTLPRPSLPACVPTSTRFSQHHPSPSRNATPIPIAADSDCRRAWPPLPSVFIPPSW